MIPLLSILIPTVATRSAQLACLLAEIDRQSANAPGVETLWLGDNRSMTIGEKRNRLLQSARGKYVAFCDDDDAILPDYVASLTHIAAAQTVDVISFRQSATWDGAQSEVHFSLSHQDEPFNPGGITRRFPWHVCAWRRDLAVRGVFTNCNWGEDAAWVAQMRELARIEAHVPEVLHRYVHGSGSLAS